MANKHFTTIEQSKTLLELGVPADSADCALIRNLYFPIGEYEIKVLDEKYSRFIEMHDTWEIHPCWSAVALLEITQSYRKPNALGCQWYDLSLTDGWDYVKLFINQIRIDIKNKIFDISKIE